MILQVCTILAAPQSFASFMDRFLPASHRPSIDHTHALSARLVSEQPESAASVLTPSRRQELPPVPPLSGDQLGCHPGSPSRLRVSEGQEQASTTPARSTLRSGTWKLGLTYRRPSRIPRSGYRGWSWVESDVYARILSKDVSTVRANRESRSV